MPGCDGAGTAKRNYPASEVGGAAKRRYPAFEVRGSNERSYLMLLSPRPGAVAGRTNPTSKEPWLHRRRRA